MDEGAPVKIRGVRIGRVKEIKAVYDPQAGAVSIPVLVEIDPSKAGEPQHMTEVPSLARVREAVQELVENKGLRARLELQSLLTGKLFVDLDFYPHTAIRLIGKETDYLEFPTIPSTTEEVARLMQDVMARLEKLPLEDLIVKTHSTIDGIDRIVNSAQILQAVASWDSTLKEINALVHSMNRELKPMAASIQTTMSATSKLVERIDGKVDPLAAGVMSSVKETRSTLQQARTTLASVQHTVGGDSALRYELTRTLEQLSAAARSIRIMADYLERYPNALIYGKSSETP